MNENPLLAQLARLCGDIVISNNPDPKEIFRLQNAIAIALFTAPSAPGLSPGRFQFEELPNFQSHHLDSSDFEHLSKVLQRVETGDLPIDKTIRVARREVPFISSQVRGSVPEWARGANIVETLR